MDGLRSVGGASGIVVQGVNLLGVRRWIAAGFNLWGSVGG